MVQPGRGLEFSIFVVRLIVAQNPMKTLFPDHIP